MNEPASSCRPRILIADDHQLVLERVAALLRSRFDVIGMAHDGRELIVEAMRLNPDVIVVDISMPELDGIQAAHQLREKGSTAKLVFLTIHGEDEFVQTCFAEGALGYVLKARMRSDLIPAIDAALSNQSFVSAS
jgi:DNA-binding NarL/FixJ family response regulator